VLQREQLGSWKERTDLELELNKWIRQYVADQENPSAEVRGRRPLRAAQIIVSDVEGEPGWYRVSLNVRPHFKYMTAPKVALARLFDGALRGSARDNLTAVVIRQ
jgi:type VI secretion system protein ImpC